MPRYVAAWCVVLLCLVACIHPSASWARRRRRSSSLQVQRQQDKREDSLDVLMVRLLQTLEESKRTSNVVAEMTMTETNCDTDMCKYSFETTSPNAAKLEIQVTIPNEGLRLSFKVFGGGNMVAEHQLQMPPAGTGDVVTPGYTGAAGEVFYLRFVLSERALLNIKIEKDSEYCSTK